MTSIRFDCWKCDISCPVRVLFPIKIVSVIHFSLLLLFLFCIFIIIVDVIVVRQRLSNIYLGGRLDVLKQIELNVDVCVNTFQFELYSTDHFSSHSYRLPIRVSSSWFNQKKTKSRSLFSLSLALPPSFSPFFSFFFLLCSHSLAYFFLFLLLFLYHSLCRKIPIFFSSLLSFTSRHEIYSPLWKKIFFLLHTRSHWIYVYEKEIQSNQIEVLESKESKLSNACKAVRNKCQHHTLCRWFRFYFSDRSLTSQHHRNTKKTPEIYRQKLHKISNWTEKRSKKNKLNSVLKARNEE